MLVYRQFIPYKIDQKISVNEFPYLRKKKNFHSQNI